MTERFPTDFPARIGIDIGRVILADATDRKDSIFSRDNYLNAKFVPHAIEAVEGIVELLRPDSVFLVSKCMPVIQQRTKEILHKNLFFDKTGVVEENVFFCEHRSDKGPIAANLNLTHFIDDRAGILKSLPLSVQKKFLFIADMNEPIDYEYIRKKSDIYPVRGWLSAYLAVQQSIAK